MGSRSYRASCPNSVRIAALLGLTVLIGSAASAAQAAGSDVEGRLAGAIAGALLAAIVIGAIAVWLWRVPRGRGTGLGWATGALLAIAFVKFGLLGFLPGLGIDVGTYEAWAGRLTEVGPVKMYQPGYFIDYPPGYLYCLWAAGAIAHGAAATGDALRIIVESPALFADFILGLVIFATLRHSQRPGRAWAAMLLFALNPALLFDTIVWGQSDSVLALLLLLSVLMLLELQYELCWALTALALLVKPQTLALMPIIGTWTLLKAGPRRWPGCALAFAAVALIGIAPFQDGRPWTWIFHLYGSTAAYYHETSVNAFNLMALIGGVRQPDTIMVLGVSCLHLGLALLVSLYAVLCYLLWRKRTEDTLMFVSFAALFGFFMIAPRMHERYLYPAVVFLIPLALDSPMLLAVFCALSATLVLNLGYVKHALEAGVFLDARDGYAMAISLVNLAAFMAVAAEFARASFDAPETWLRENWRGFLTVGRRFALDNEEREGLAPVAPWIRADTIVLASLVVLAAATRFWRLWFPGEIVFDEVHFVGQARHYLHAEPFLDPHPPLAKLLIAMSIAIFGDHSWSWRLPNATLGTALVAITYLLGRRMFNSRLVGCLAAAFVLCDGMFLVDSRVAVLDIVYLTFGAWSYLCLFRFAQTQDSVTRRRLLIPIALALGLALSAKLYVPAVTFLLVGGFLVYLLASTRARVGSGRKLPGAPDPLLQRIGGAVALILGLGGIVYLGSFLPHFWLGWWGGIEDLFHYYGQVVWYEQSVSTATHPYAAPWWSWPLLLRPIAYWQNFPPTGRTVATIWGGGNPVLWWGALTGITIAWVEAIERRSVARWFLVLGYLGYLCVWMPIGRTLFLYHYMPSLYLGFIALAAVMAECWEGRAQLMEHVALLLTLAPVFVLGLGIGIGSVAFVALLAAYVALLGRGNYPGKLVCVAFLATAGALFIYYFPVWTGLPIERAGYYARMWLQGPGLRNWI